MPTYSNLIKLQTCFIWTFYHANNILRYSAKQQIWNVSFLKQGAEKHGFYQYATNILELEPICTLAKDRNVIVKWKADVH